MSIQTTKYKGKTFKVIDRRTKAQYMCEGKHGGDPMTKFISTKMLTPAELSKRESQLKAEYDTVEMTFAHEITTLFREVINRGDDSKDVDVVNAQRQFKNGKWSDVDPLQEMKDLGEEYNASRTALKDKVKEFVGTANVKSKAARIILWTAIVAITAFVIAALVKMAIYLKIKG